MTDQPERFGPFVVDGKPVRLDAGGLSGGAFGAVARATDARGNQVVVKTPRATGGSRSNTYAFEEHLPDLGYRRDAAPVHMTFGASTVADVLQVEAELLERADGFLLPKLVGGYEQDGRGALTMELLTGRVPRTSDDVVAVLEMLVRAVEVDALDYHGDLKPEHIFLDDENESVRVVDPAPRFTDPTLHAFTPEYNPYGLSGPVADVFAIAVMLYQVMAGVGPFFWTWRPSAPGSADGRAVEVPPPVARGRLDVPARLAAFVDAIVLRQPADLPEWADDHRAALEQLTSAP